VLFIESPESVEELQRIGRAFAGVPLLANMVEGGRTPRLSAVELAGLGFKIGLYPVTGLLAAAAALRAAFVELNRTKGGSVTETPLLQFADMTAVMGFAEAVALETAANS